MFFGCQSLGAQASIAVSQTAWMRHWVKFKKKLKANKAAEDRKASVSLIFYSISCTGKSGLTLISSWYNFDFFIVRTASLVHFLVYLSAWLFSFDYKKLYPLLTVHITQNIYWDVLLKKHQRGSLYNATCD